MRNKIKQLINKILFALHLRDSYLYTNKHGGGMRCRFHQLPHEYNKPIYIDVEELKREINKAFPPSDVPTNTTGQNNTKIKCA